MGGESKPGINTLSAIGLPSEEKRSTLDNTHRKIIDLLNVSPSTATQQNHKEKPIIQSNTHGKLAAALALYVPKACNVSIGKENEPPLVHFQTSQQYVAKSASNTTPKACIILSRI